MIPENDLVPQQSSVRTKVLLAASFGGGVTLLSNCCLRALGFLGIVIPASPPRAAGGRCVRLSREGPPAFTPPPPAAAPSAGAVCVCVRVCIIQSPWDSESGLTRSSADWLTVSAPRPPHPRVPGGSGPQWRSLFTERAGPGGAPSPRSLPSGGPARAASGEDTWPSCSLSFPSPHRPERSGKGEGMRVGGGVPGPGDPAVTRARELARTLEMYP